MVSLTESQDGMPLTTISSSIISSSSSIDTSAVPEYISPSQIRWQEDPSAALRRSSSQTSQAQAQQATPTSNLNHLSWNRPSFNFPTSNNFNNTDNGGGGEGYVKIKITDTDNSSSSASANTNQLGKSKAATTVMYPFPILRCHSYSPNDTRALPDQATYVPTMTAINHIIITHPINASGPRRRWMDWWYLPTSGLHRIWSV